MLHCLVLTHELGGNFGQIGLTALVYQQFEIGNRERVNLAFEESGHNSILLVGVNDRAFQHIMELAATRDSLMEHAHIGADLLQLPLLDGKIHQRLGVSRGDSDYAHG